MLHIQLDQFARCWSHWKAADSAADGVQLADELDRLWMAVPPGKLRLCHLDVGSKPSQCCRFPQQEKCWLGSKHSLAENGVGWCEVEVKYWATFPPKTIKTALTSTARIQAARRVAVMLTNILPDVIEMKNLRSISSLWNVAYYNLHS